MSDQAQTLRELSKRGNIVPLRPRRDRTIAVTGGKGGVGKSTLAVNLAVSYARLGAKTLAIDADLGMADLNLMLGVAPERSLQDVIAGEPIDEVLIDVHGIHLLPALNGSYTLANIDLHTRHALFSAIDTLDKRFDTVVVDIAAGIGANAVAFAGAVADVLCVVTPEATSLANAYACLKVLSSQQELTHAYIVPNRVRSPSEAEDVIFRLSALVSRFLGLTLAPLPAIPLDGAVPAAAAAGIPLIHYSPDSPASRAIRQIARRLDSLALPDQRQGLVRLFWRGVFQNKDEEKRAL